MKTLREILGKVFNCGASQCIPIHNLKKDTLTIDQALQEIQEYYLSILPEELKGNSGFTITYRESYHQVLQDIKKRIKE